MGHARRMQNNRRRQIWEMIKEKDNERSRNDSDNRLPDGREYETILEGQDSVPRNERTNLF